MNATNPDPAPDDAAPKRATKAEVIKRVEEIFSIRQAGAGFHDVREYAVAQKWGVSNTQLYRYMQQADDLMSESLEKDRSKLLDLHVARRRLLFARCIESGDWRAALAVIDSEARLLGLIAPTKVENVNPPAALQVNIVEKIRDPVPAAPPGNGTEPGSAQLPPQ
jgi:hypothetical protein